jgi:hypothetical protein
MLPPICGALLRALTAAALLVGSAAAAQAAPDDAILYRVFLRDGDTLISYGELARVGADVVLSIPISGADTDMPRLQLVSLSESLVDWTRTDAYAEAARAKYFAETRGESEFARLSTEVARALNEVAFTEDPVKRLASIDRARNMMAEWPARNYGYRANDVSQLSAMLDEVASELRVAAGQSRFDVALVANTTPAAPVPLLPPPTLRQSIEQAFTVARITPDSIQRVTLLRAVTDVLADRPRDESWAAALRARATADLALALRTDRAYADLSARLLKRADERVQRADVKALEQLVRDALKGDDRLGRLRPQESAALLATLDVKLQSARRLRLARDHWTLQLGIVRAYERKVRGAIDLLVRVRPSLELIRQLAGPGSKPLQQLQKNAASTGRELELVKPSPQLESVHGMLLNALQLAVRAADARSRAIAGNDIQLAWQASSAAAGALLLVERAREELQRLAAPPVP